MSPLRPVCQWLTPCTTNVCSLLTFAWGKLHRLKRWLLMWVNYLERGVRSLSFLMSSNHWCLWTNTTIPWTIQGSALTHPTNPSPLIVFLQFLLLPHNATSQLLSFGMTTAAPDVWDHSSATYREALLITLYTLWSICVSLPSALLHFALLRTHKPE